MRAGFFSARDFAAIFATWTLASCARVAPPPGGPVDSDPPSLASTIPGADSSGVDRAGEVVLIFSERMDRRSVMKALRVMPRVDFRATTWAVDTLRLRPEEGWAADRTTLVWVAPSAEDSRGNRLGTPRILRFTTRNEWGKGTIVGGVAAGGERTPDMTLIVGLLEGDRADSASVFTSDPEALVAPEADGSYRMTKISAGTYRIVGFLDRDGDLRELSRGETWAVAESTITLPEGSIEIHAPEFLVGTLDSAGTIAGDVTADSGAVVVEAHADSARVDFAGRVVRTGSGPFSIRLPTGRAYYLRAFADVDADSTLGHGEIPVALEKPVPLILTSRQTGLRFDVRAGEKGKTP